ncbi:DNA repair protein Nse1 [Lobosporangium transversale]|uniref:Non-structural maintenance of chromosomes element 1 homolog n=1 Tax=Lobosporangium transversale TaxID=64571 RepID=A0A1Y2H0F1_9FUNG|nr:DNA repair protein Nse1 [Lobosporangium transversale]ORZ27524.1 DNA repair protein Nse1 [Lobosporangium transversale]|eukprot:XP_021885251.1 DNA repair protein Nse1 [Lobosporangium transversale]
MVASGFTDTHRLFLQAAMSRRIMTEVVALDIYARVCQATNDRFDREQFSDFVDQLNTGLNSVELEFRKAQDEVTGTPVIALTNTNGQKIAQVATGYTPTELEYFKHLLDAIVMADDETYCISATAALHEAGHLKNKENKVLVLTKRDAEALLDRFVADKWFIKSAAGAYSLSMRSLLELQTYLKETYGEQIQECTLCMEIITKGQRCSVAACSSRLHQHCASTYFRNMNNPVCPTCHSAWSGKVLIGLSDKMSAPSKVQRRARRTANGAAAIAGDNEDEDIERDEE